jgi:hypothetical protein
VNALLRVALMAYPRPFRREYGTEWARTLRDLQLHSGHSTPRVMVTAVSEALTTAPRMRWENLMKPTKTALMIVVGAIALVALMMGSEAIILLLVAVLALALLQLAGKDRPVTAGNSTATQRWYLWLAGAAAAFGVGFAALAIDGDDELSSTVWAIWMLSWATAALLGAIGLTLGATRLIANRR